MKAWQLKREIQHTYILIVLYIQATRCKRMFANYVSLTLHTDSTPIWGLGNLASRASID